MQVLVIARVATDQISSEKRAAHARVAAVTLVQIIAAVNLILFLFQRITAHVQVAAVTLVLAIARLDRASITSLSHLKHSTFSARSAHADFAALTYQFIFDIQKRHQQAIGIKRYQLKRRSLLTLQAPTRSVFQVGALCVCDETTSRRYTGLEILSSH